MKLRAVRIGVYSDLLYRRAPDGTVSADRAFIRFVTALPPRAEVVVFGRLDPEPGAHPYALPAGVRFVPLPHYPSVTDLPRVVAAVRGSLAAFRRELPALDVLWLFGPHPIGVLVALAARRTRTQVVLGVRQDYPSYIAGRLPSRRWVWAVAAAHALDRVWRLLARRRATVVVGEALRERYGGFATGFSLVAEEDVVTEEAALAKRWDGPVRILSVGRLDPEKNPGLLLDAFSALRERDPGWTLEIVGDGPLYAEIAERATATEGVELRGYVPNGPRLRDLYRRAHVFLHVSLTEGVPQVLFEAQAAGLPVVATDVGGVRAAVGGDALLVPPRDAAAIVAALERLRDDPDLRRRLIVDSLAHVRQETTEAQLDRIVDYIRSSTTETSRSK